ncbi:cystatin-A-like [Leptodactylus fuscus]|uniref:cystatin-A-like n=1 Tax=Leptodactylus fuscus TaxID=238119 RepID=UPI003F4E7F23
MDGAQHKCDSGHPPILPGGLGAEHSATREIQDYCNLVKPEFLRKTALNVSKFEAISYKSQVVAGTNYYVKVDLGGGQYCHLRIFVPLPHTGGKPSLNNYQLGRSREDPIFRF